MTFRDVVVGAAPAVVQGGQPNEVGSHGHVQFDDVGELGRVIRRIRPYPRCDYWEVGGRFAGFFKLKDGVPPDPARLSSIPPAAPERGDQVLVGEIEVDGMRIEPARKAAEMWVACDHRRNRADVRPPVPRGGSGSTVGLRLDCRVCPR